MILGYGRIFVKEWARVMCSCGLRLGQEARVC